ncbi:VQ motif-containing protein 8, chloroplastic-like [Coffea arabica]|uniref:VQ motif-containing protein 8, chloroplastic-like n=1 Tax=Coffea arabica TaxID=13443 RepID=A0A6P6V623_COFAR
MDPVNFFREEPRRVINGPHPSPLRINKDSHVIQKPSSMNQVYKKAATEQNTRLSTQQPRQPVIIYTHSPKIIHTKPKDFMALVQKLTGFSRSEEQIVEAESKRDDQTITISQEDNDSSSVTSDDKYEGDNASDVIKESSSAVSPVNKGLNPYLTDIPLFTPNSNLFSSPQPVFRYPDVVFTSPNIVSSLSPSFVEFMKGLPEY